MPRDGSPNPCFAYLQGIGYAVSYAPEAIPKVMRGQSRLDALPAEGPHGVFPSALQKMRRDLLHEKRCLEERYGDYQQPDDPVQAGSRVGDLLSAVTTRWYEDFCDGGRHLRVDDRLQDRWIDILGRIPIDFESWAIRTFILWGKHIMPDIVAELLDGEIEYHIDQEFADLIYEFDEYHIEQLWKLDQRLRLLDQPAPLPTAHRPVRPPQCNAQPRTVPHHEVPRLFEGQAQWQEDLMAVQWEDMPPDALTPMVQDLELRPSFVIVHLFSGRRRECDIHHWLEAWSRRTNIALTIISMDTAISPVLGNLDCRAESWATLSSLYLQGKIAATISGHPCETFSSARWHPPPDEVASRKWPRPLRTAMQLFGLDHRTWRELQQTRTGSAFFLQTLWCLACHLAYGGLFVEEHPGIPIKEHHPSVWKSALSRLFRRHPDIALHEIAQWRFGATTVKPTGLMSLRMPFFLRDLYLHADAHAIRPTSQAIGVDRNGEFRTACHKEYPKRLSAGIACAIAHQLQRNLRARTVVHTAGPAPPLAQWIKDIARDSAVIRSQASY